MSHFVVSKNGKRIKPTDPDYPLQPIQVHFKTDEEVTEQYHDQLRKKQTTLDNHQKIHKMDEYR